MSELQRTVMVLGPGGIGKSPLDALFQESLVRIDPYRLRPTGPRDSNDVLYAHPRLQDEFHFVLNSLGDPMQSLGDAAQPVEWFPKSRVLLFKMRDIWELVVLGGFDGQIAKTEWYAPVLVDLLSKPELDGIFGQELDILILHPADRSIMELRDWEDIRRQTRRNCTERGDSLQSIETRVNSIPEEVPAWQELIRRYGATEYPQWQFPEYLYKRPPAGTDMHQHQKQMLLQARHRLLQGNASLEVYLKTEDEIRRMDKLPVK